MTPIQSFCTLEQPGYRSTHQSLEAINLLTAAADLRAKIAMNSVLRWEASEGAGPRMVSHLDGKSTGRMTWDLAAGELVKAAGSQQMTMTMGFRGRKDPKDPPPKFSIEISATGMLERVELEDLRLPADKAKRGRNREGK